jgi:hypothetical protein
LKSITTDWHLAGTGDFDGDGRDDILWRNDSGLTVDWLGQANGGFAQFGGPGFDRLGGGWHRRLQW